MTRLFSARELAELQLPGLPATLENCSRFIARVRLTSPDLVVERRGKGGGAVLSLFALPEAARAELARRQSAQALVPADGAELAAAIEADQRQIAARVTGHLTPRQRHVMEARATILLAIDQRALLAGVGRSRAVAAFLEDLRRGAMDPAQCVVIDRARGRAARTGLSRSTIYEWFAARERAGIVGLAPELTRDKSDLPIWFDGFLRHYQKPSKPSVLEALRGFSASLPSGSEVPTERQVRLALAKLPQLQRLKGREGKLALRARMAYTARSFDDVLPTSIYVADGKTFDAEIAHPIHGQPFRPELTTIIDVATRRVVGWSASLDENTFGVVDALRQACERRGIPAIFYTDRGPGYRNAAMDGPLTGFLGRAGITAMRALPYNSQAKGVVERLNQLYTGAAKRLPTYIGKDMDKEGKLLVHKATRRELKQVGASRILPSWADFLALIDAEIEAYNNRPHSSLPKMRDAQIARTRHMTPAELWAAKTVDFEPVLPEPGEVADMWRPYVKRRTRRALVEWLGNSYFAPALEALDGQDIVVGYDIHDASRVWCREIGEVDGTLQPGRLIAIAAFNGHVTRYVPLSYEQAAMERRAKGRVGRLQAKLDVVQQELRPAALLQATAAPVFEMPAAPPVATDVAGVAPAASSNPASQVLRDRPMFRDDVGFARWLSENPHRVTETDRSLLRDLLTTHSTKELLRMSGVDLEALRKLVRSDAGQAGAAATGM